MKGYSFCGHNRSIICLGYKQHVMKELFDNYFLHNRDFTFDYRDGRNGMTVIHQHCKNWKVTVVDTGLHTMTGERIKRIQEYVGNEKVNI